MLIEFLAKTSNIRQEKLASLSMTASRRYKVYKIRKRDGTWRTIEHPSRELKALQRWIVKALFSRFPVHEAATAYRKGSGIRENANRHKHTKYTNRYDFMNFFPSFKQPMVELFVRQETVKLGMELTDEDVAFVGNIVCRNGKLTIGAPSSPSITNTMMFTFDAALHEYCLENNLIFTRYADDIFISAFHKDQLHNIENEIRRAKRDVSHLSLRINSKKTAKLSKKYRRTITGVVITPENTLSIGRHRKREIKALIHQWMKGDLELENISYLRGLLGYAIDIEPNFRERLENKYGSASIKILIHDPNLPDNNPFPY